MNPLGKLRTENLVDGAMGIDPAFAGESRGRDANPEMGFSALAPAAMAGVIRAFVEDLETLGLKRRAQFVFDACFETHCGLSNKPFRRPI